MLVKHCMDALILDCQRLSGSLNFLIEISEVVEIRTGYVKQAGKTYFPMSATQQR